MRRERAAFLISLNAIDSHLPSTRRPPTARCQGSALLKRQKVCQRGGVCVFVTKVILKHD